MKRCVVNLATGYFLKGQARLKERVTDAAFLGLDNPAVIGAPSHAEKPYAFKSYALKAAERLGFTSLLWADACIVPTGPLDRIWERVAKYGVWFSKNGYWNYEWTANSAYADLGVTVEENKKIQHVVGGAFALDLTHAVGRTFLAEHFRLASETRAFCGPWTGGIGVQHRHDQTVSSVLAHRLQIPLTDPPDYFAYRGGETDRTLLVADGNYD